MYKKHLFKHSYWGFKCLTCGEIIIMCDCCGRAICNCTGGAQGGYDGIYECKECDERGCYEE